MRNQTETRQPVLRYASSGGARIISRSASSTKNAPRRFPWAHDEAGRTGELDADLAGAEGRVVIQTTYCIVIDLTPTSDTYFPGEFHSFDREIQSSESRISFSLTTKAVARSVIDIMRQLA